MNPNWGKVARFCPNDVVRHLYSGYQQTEFCENTLKETRDSPRRFEQTSLNKPVTRK